MTLPKECITLEAQKITTRSEKGKRIKIDNPRELPISVIRVDGCAIKSGNKCDFMFEIDDAETSIFVELKGSNIKHAIKQLEETIKKYKKRKPGYKKLAIIVSSKVAPSTKTYLQRAKVAFKRELNAKLANANITFTYNV